MRNLGTEIGILVWNSQERWVKKTCGKARLYVL